MSISHKKHITQQASEQVSMCDVGEWKALASGKYFEEIEHIEHIVFI